MISVKSYIQKAANCEADPKRLDFDSNYWGGLHWQPSYGDNGPVCLSIFSPYFIWA